MYARSIIDNKVNVGVIFKVVEEFDDVFVVKTVHNLDFSCDLFNHPTVFKPLFVHLFNSINHLRLLMLNLGHQTKCTLYNQKLIHKIFSTLTKVCENIKIRDGSFFFPTGLDDGGQEQ